MLTSKGELPGSSVMCSVRPAREMTHGTSIWGAVGQQCIRTRRPRSAGDHWEGRWVYFTLWHHILCYFQYSTSEMAGALMKRESWWSAWSVLVMSPHWDHLCWKPTPSCVPWFPIPKWCLCFSSSLGGHLNRPSAIQLTHSLLSTTCTPSSCSYSNSSLHLPNAM